MYVLNTLININLRIVIIVILYTNIIVTLFKVMAQGVAAYEPGAHNKSA